MIDNVVKNVIQMAQNFLSPESVKNFAFVEPKRNKIELQEIRSYKKLFKNRNHKVQGLLESCGKMSRYYLEGLDAALELRGVVAAPIGPIRHKQELKIGVPQSAHDVVASRV